MSHVYTDISKNKGILDHLSKGRVTTLCCEYGMYIGLYTLYLLLVNIRSYGVDDLYKWELLNIVPIVTTIDNIIINSRVTLGYMQEQK